YMLRGGETQGGCGEFTDDYVFFKVDKIRTENVDNLPVYNIEVEEDNSYCLPMIAVHNCQAFSVAGKRKGFEDTRGTLFFEIARIAKKTQPKALWLEVVDFEILNSKYFGVPQNRERIFIIAVREDLIEQEPWIIEGNTIVPKGKRRISGYSWAKTFNFDWPEQTEVTTKLRDILESDVDEKYYLDEEKTAKLVVELEEQKAVMGGGHREPKVAEEVRPVLTPDRLNKRQNGRRFKEDGEEMFTLTSQ